MELHQIEPQHELSGDPIASITPGIIYHITTGRNAWHSTWVTHYHTGCMHTTLESAKSYAEKNRARGTVFYITQIPCLVFRSKNQILFVTEINSQNPLHGYFPNAITNSSETNNVKIKSSSDNYIKIGASLFGVGLSFLPESRFWHISPEKENSVMLLSHSNSNISVNRKGLNKLDACFSRSNGSNYYLDWFPRENTICSSAIAAIVNEYKNTPAHDHLNKKIDISDTPSQKKNQPTENISKVVKLSENKSSLSHKSLVRLRVIASSRGDHGSTKNRDETIQAFLDELSQVISFKVIDNFSDDALRGHYLKWIKAAISGSDANQRIDWMASHVILFLCDFKFEA